MANPSILRLFPPNFKIKADCNFL